MNQPLNMKMLFVYNNAFIFHDGWVNKLATNPKPPRERRILHSRECWSMASDVLWSLPEGESERKAKHCIPHCLHFKTNRSRNQGERLPKCAPARPDRNDVATNLGGAIIPPQTLMAEAWNPRRLCKLIHRAWTSSGNNKSHPYRVDGQLFWALLHYTNLESPVAICGVESSTNSHLQATNQYTSGVFTSTMDGFTCIGTTNP